MTECRSYQRDYLLSAPLFVRSHRRRAAAAGSPALSPLAAIAGRETEQRELAPLRYHPNPDLPASSTPLPPGQAAAAAAALAV
jgi:hypothetical protein